MNRPDIEPLKDLIEKAGRKAQSTGSDVLVSHIQSIDPVDLVDLFTATESTTSDRWYWEHLERDSALLSLGILTGATPPRNVRFNEVNRYVRQYAASATVSTESGVSLQSPILHAGFSFDPYHQQDRLVWQGFPSAYLLTPRMTIAQDGDRFTLAVNTFATPNLSSDTLFDAASAFLDEVINALGEFHESTLIVDEADPDKSNASELRQFVSAASRAEAAVRRGDFEVLNVARQKKITTGGIYRVNRALEYLRNRFPQSRITAVGRHGSTFLGVAPDLLFSRSGSTIESTCAAGSIRRGKDPDLDSALSEQLLRNSAEVEFHELCVDHLYECLEHHCSKVEASGEPEIRSTTDRHHLHSRLTGTLKDGISLLDLVESSHPVVNTGGMPADEAAQFLHAEEQTDRGWFTAPQGWLDLNGNGEIVTADVGAVVRAPVLQQQRAYLFSLATIHSGVDPEDLIAQTDESMAVVRYALSR